MKLLNKTGIYTILGSALVFVLGGFIFYNFLNMEINTELAEKLYQEKYKIESQLQKLDSLPALILEPSDPVQFEEVEANEFKTEFKFVDTLIYDKYEDENVPSRQIRFYAKAKAKIYYVIISKSLLESEDLVDVITKALAILFVIFLFFIYLLNRFVSKKIWSPFFVNLNKIKEFDLSALKPLQLENSDINEFKQLNQVILNMTSKMQGDYKSLKEFSENASHEIQTPLAIIKSKLELLIQSESLKEDQMQAIQSVYDAANRLSRLNQALILLSKIENHQFEKREQINFSELIKKHISNFSELIEAKEIKLKQSVQNNVILTINPILADILISNLITNAIKHNAEKGEIEIKLLADSFLISNTGEDLKANPLELFERFKKENTGSESLGLGLSIVKKIIESEKLLIEYSYQKPNHIIQIKF